MGYLDTFPTSRPFSPGLVDETYTPPSRTTRDKCWAARDSFFACLDAHGIVDSIKDPEGVKAAQQHCSRQDAVLGRDCASSWVKYFKERRIMEQRKKAMIQGLEAEGATAIGGTMPPNLGPKAK